MRKLLLCVTLLLLTNARAAGQGGEAGAGTPPPPYGRLDDLKGEAARLLESRGSRERAWGAHMAGRHGLKSLAPELVRLLSDPTLGDGPEEWHVRQAALDALIRLDAEVPAEALRALPQAFADEVLILLARSPGESQAALLEMFAGQEEGGGGGVLWLAAGNLLAAAKARGFAARLLGGLKVEAAVTVLDPGDDSHGIGGGYGYGSGGCGAGFDPPPAGFPPVGYYSLTAEEQRGAVVVAPGRRSVFYLRAAGRGGCGHFSVQYDGDVARVEYLAGLLDTSEAELDLDARPSFTVVCRDAGQCRRELAGVRGRVRQSYGALVARLLEKGLLDGAGDAPASPPMTFTLYDERRRKDFPLPDTLKGVTVLAENAGAGAAAGAEGP